jgi:hypothetical protein
MDVFLWSHIALIRAMNICMHSLPLPLTAHEIIWPQHPDKSALPRNLNILIRLKYDDMYSQLQIL